MLLCLTRDSNRFSSTKVNPCFFSPTCFYEREEFLQSTPMRPSLLNSTNKKAAGRIMATRTNTSIRSLRSRHMHKNAHVKSDEESLRRPSILQKHKDEENMVQRLKKDGNLHTSLVIFTHNNEARASIILKSLTRF
jgi:hypothetical protein